MITNAPRRGLGLCSKRRKDTAIRSICHIAFDATVETAQPVSYFTKYCVERTDASQKKKWRRQTTRWKSSAGMEIDYEDGLDRPMGTLFQLPEIGPSLIGMTGSIKRSFGPQANAEAMLTCGGEALAADSSFDPNYGRAKDWIRSHPVGPAKLSPILISGLVGALVEAAFPQAIVLRSSMEMDRPLIVGVDVRAKIEVVAVEHFDGYTAEDDSTNDEVQKRNQGYQVDLNTAVSRVRDDLLIARGTHSIWIPDYLHM